MQIKLYQIIIFICVIVTATMIIFPKQHFIAQELINSGRLETARLYIKHYTSTNPDDALLFIMSSNTYLIEGNPGKAIDELKSFLNQEKVSKKVLLRLIQLYEWEREPELALKALERTTRIFPNDINIWKKMIGYYRYFGNSEKEIDAIISLARLNHQQIKKDAILQAIDQKMVDIADEHVNNNDPMTSYLLSRLTIVRENYADNISDPTIGKNEQQEIKTYTITRIFELYVYADLIDDIKMFAQQLDRQLNTGITNRISLMTVFRWAGMDDEAVAYLWDLQKEERYHNEVLNQIVTISLQNGEYKGAIDALKKLLLSDPNNETYSFKLAQLYVESENYAGAYDIYTKLSELFPGKEYQELVIQTALHSNQKKLALDAIKRVESIQNKSPEMINYLAEIFLFLEQPARAYTYKQQYVDTLKPPDRNHLKQLLDIAVWSNQQTNIDQSFVLVQQYFPEDTELMVKCGDAYLSKGKPEQAYKIYGSVIHLKTDDREFLIKYMETASYTQSPEIMISCALTVSKLRSNDYKLINKCVQLLQWSNQMTQAYILYEDWFHQYGRTTEQTQQLLNLAQATGDPIIVKKAVQLSKQSIPKNPDFLLEIAEQSIASGLTNEAIYAFEAYLMQKKDDSSVQKKLAELFVWSGQLESAFQLYQQLHERFPDDIFVRDKMIEIASWTKNSSATAYLVAEMAEASPSVYTLQIKAGDALVAAGQTQKSIPFFERALQKKPDNIDLLRKLSQYFGWLEQYNDSIRVLEKIASLGQITTTERIQVAQFYMDHKKPQKAIRLLNGLTEQQLEQSSGILLAIAYEQTGQQTKAIALYKFLARKYPDNPDILLQMGNQLLWMNQLDTALSFYEQTLSIDPGQLEALKGCAQIYLSKNNAEKAIQYFNQYVKLNPNDYEVLYQLGELLFAKGQKNNAFKHYQKALALINRAKKDAVNSSIQ